MFTIHCYEDTTLKGATIAAVDTDGNIEFKSEVG